MSLKELRLKRGLSQRQLADMVEVSQRRVYDYEVGNKPIENMTLGVALRFCKALRVSNPKRLLEESDSSKEKNTSPGD